MNFQALPDGPFATIVADPPWQYSNKATRNAADQQYDTLSVGEICTLPVRRVAAENAHLYLWTTTSFIFEAKAIVAAWGFTYKTQLIWHKTQLGMGNYFRVTHEIVLFGVRGKLRTQDKSISSVFVAPRNKHSAKPRVFYDTVEVASPGPYLELFARSPREGWTVWGNEA